jgi:large subunit ribosomal protein L10
MSTTEKRPRPEKVEEVEILRGILERSQGAIIADYRGLNVKALNTLRKRLRETDGSVRIIKNTLVKRAAVGLPMEKLVADLEGPTALAYTETDAVGAAKVIAGFVKEFKILKVKGGKRL